MGDALWLLEGVNFLGDNDVDDALGLIEGIELGGSFLDNEVEDAPGLSKGGDLGKSLGKHEDEVVLARGQLEVEGTTDLGDLLRDNQVGHAFRCLGKKNRCID